MTVLLLGVSVLLAAAAGGWWWLRQPVRRAAPPAPNPAQPAKPLVADATPAQQTPTTPAAASTLHTGHNTPLPEALATFVWRKPDQMIPGKRDALLAAIRDIPRPPAALQRLLSPSFSARAGPRELAELLMGEPLIAAQVLASANSPLHGLSRPVTDLDQAIALLGMQRVRDICLQHLLADTVTSRLPGVQKTLDTLWKGCALASELALQLEKALRLPAPGSLATQVVLAFIGPRATASVLPATVLPAWLQRDRLARTRLEQDLLDLNAVEIGVLLMRAWDLPTDLVDEVHTMGRLLVTPPQAVPPERLPRAALGCLCMHLGEQLAPGKLTLDAALALSDGPQTHHLRAALQSTPALMGVEQALRSPALVAALQQACQPPAHPATATA